MRGQKHLDNKEKRTGKDLQLNGLFDLCEFDLGRVDLTVPISAIKL